VTQDGEHGRTAVGQRWRQLPGGMPIRSHARGRQHTPGTQSGQPAGPGLAEMVTNCPPDHSDHETCPCREWGRAKRCTALLQICPSPGMLSPALVLTSTVRLPGVVLPSEGDVIEFGTLQLSEVLGAWRAVLWPHSQQSARWWDLPSLLGGQELLQGSQLRPAPALRGDGHQP